MMKYISIKIGKNELNVNNWCKENCVGEWKFFGSGLDEQTQKYWVLYGFVKDEDAMAFRLSFE